MKRSKMVKKLGRFLNKELKIVSINAEPILDFLEKEGMLPPYNKKKHLSDLSLRKDTIVYCQWEPEDEE